MRFHYAGRYHDDPSSLPGHTHEPDYTAFDEPQTMEELVKIVSMIDLVIFVIVLIVMLIRGGYRAFHLFGLTLYLLFLIPHELLHALCFQGDVYMYTNLKRGLLFVIGPEVFSKSRFIFMSLFPNVVLGLIPFLVFLIEPSHTILGTLGLLALPSGAGDYLNVYHALTQMPAGSYVYMNGFNSFWFMPSHE